MKDCRGELLHRVRKGTATSQEQTAFEAHLQSCESCRMTLALMDDLDSAGEPEPGDSQRVAQMADAGAIAFGREVPARARVKRRPWQLALAALVLTGAAAAGVAVTRLGQESPRDVEPPASSGAPNAQHQPKPTLVEETPASEATKEAEAPPEKPKKESALPSTSDRSQAPAKTATTASATYRAANDARRAGRTKEAIEGYRRLQSQFPGSAEAHASRVSLGGLLLRTGATTAALAQFDAYLASSGGQLTAEALFGKAQALRALGRSAEEAQNLKRLVSTYPHSAYATHAERRLTELR